MLVNVLDLRERPYRWSNVLAVVQSATKDNVAEDADVIQSKMGVEIDYAERDGLSVRDAVLWAERLDGMVTLYLYDRDPETPADERPL
jgi:hypothetical protein